MDGCYNGEDTMSPDGLHNTQDIVVVQVVLCLTAQRNQINQFGIAICVDSISESALRTHHGSSFGLGS